MFSRRRSEDRGNAISSPARSVPPARVSEIFAKDSGVAPKVFRPPKFLIYFIAGSAERKARNTGEDAPITKAMIADVYGKHLIYDSTKAQTELGWTFRAAEDVMRDAVRWVVFMDALKPKVDRKVRAHLGSAVAPDPGW